MRKFVYAISLAGALTGLGMLAGCQQQNVGGIVLNEICGKDADGLEWIEVGNSSDQAINLKDYKLRKIDEEGIDKKLFEFPDTMLAPGAIYIVNQEDFKKKAHIPNKKAVVIELEDAEGNVVDTFDSMEELNLEGHPAGASYARLPNLTGQWVLSKGATWNKPNDSTPDAPAAEASDDDLEDEE